VLKSLKASGLVIGLLAGLALSNLASALGLGTISVTTGLGQPLQAEIELVAVGKTEKSSLFARMAPPEVYEAAGVDYPDTLPKLKLRIETRANGDPYLSVTSALPVNDPFVSLLVELSWATGRLLREYTFLLDPPGFKAEAESTPVQPILSLADNTPAAVAVPIPAPNVPPTRAPAETPNTLEEEESPPKRQAPQAHATPVKKVVGDDLVFGVVTVQRGDTLSEIATREKAPDISLERMLVALYRANADAFDGKNMNRLRTGKILRLPEESEINKVSQADAVREFHAQAADWNAYRHQLAGASDTVTESTLRQESSGKISTRVTEAVPAVSNPGKEVVRLSKGEAPGDKAAAGDDKALRNKLQTLEEEAIARNQQLKEGNARIALLEKNIKDMQRLIELKAQSLPPTSGTPSASGPTKPVPAPLPSVSKPEPAAVVPQQQSSVAPVPVFQQLNAAEPASGTVARGVAGSATSAVQAVKPGVSPTTVPDSMLDELLNNPLLLAAGAALLGLLALILMRLHRNKGGKPLSRSASSAEDTGARITAPVTPSPDTGDFTGSPVTPSSVTESDDVDPITEADLFLNFGRDGQAEEILKEALLKNPGNQQIRLKLLSIYAKRKDAVPFAAIAGEVRNSGDVAAWALAAEMGRKLDPANPLYSDGSAETADDVPESHVTGETVPVEPAPLDFDLGSGEPPAAAPDVPPTPGALSESTIDFDLGEATPQLPVIDPTTTVVLNAASTSSAGVDFELHPEEPAPAPAPAADDPTVTTDKSPDANGEIRAAAVEPMAAPVEEVTAQSPDVNPQDEEQRAIAAADLDDLIFDVSYPEKEALPGEEEKKLTGNDDSMAFMLDFPIEEPAVSPVAAPPGGHRNNEEITLSDINLNLDNAATPSDGAKDSSWYDVATKLDLARAYHEMGDAAGAREILEEVLADGDTEQRTAAEAMLKQLSA
jgi:pilus assembly protein FimV